MKNCKTLKNILISTAILLLPIQANADTTAEIDAKAAEALNELYAESPAAKMLGANAKALLIFPNITKAGIGIGGEFGKGVLQSNGETNAYYKSVSVSVGWQLGVAKRSQVIMFMEQETLDKFVQSQGWEAGVDANIVVVDLGETIEKTTTNNKDQITAFVFNEKGLMVGVSLEGSKFTKINQKS